MERRRQMDESEVPLKHYIGLDDKTGETPCPELEDGRRLGKAWLQKLPQRLVGLQLKDPDSYYRDTFVVVTWGSHEMQRFSTASAFWCLQPSHKLRALAVRISTSYYFNYMMSFVVLLTCFCQVVKEQYPKLFYLEMTFWAFYIFEAIVKILARGLVLSTFSFLRNGWNVLDFILILFMPLTLLNLHAEALQSLRWFRLLRILTCFNGPPRLLVVTYLRSLLGFRDILWFGIISLLLVSLCSLQFYMGELGHKCVVTYNKTSGPTFGALVTNKEYWLKEESYRICGNATGAVKCPERYTCLANVGKNPDYGCTNFDTYGWALLNTLRIVLQDFWEDILIKMTSAMGGFQAFYFLLMIIISVFTFGFTLAHVLCTYLNIAAAPKRDKEQEIDVVFQELFSTRTEAPIDTESGEEIYEYAAHTPLKTYCFRLSCSTNLLKWECCKCWVDFSKALSNFILHPWTEISICLIIIYSTINLSFYHYQMGPSFSAFFEISLIITVLLFLLELIIKILALSPKDFFADGWNTFDFIILACMIVASATGDNFNGLLFLFPFRIYRVLLSVPMVSTSKRLLSILRKSLPDFGCLALLLIIVLFLLAVMGADLFGHYYLQEKHLFPDEKIPDWNMVDVPHTFMLVLRILGGEWIETLWDCYLVAGGTCIPYYLVCLVFTHLVMAALFVSIVLRRALEPFEEGSQPLQASTSHLIAQMVGRVVNYVTLGICCRHSEQDPSQKMVATAAEPEIDGAKIGDQNGTVSEEQQFEDNSAVKSSEKATYYNEECKPSTSIYLSTPPDCLPSSLHLSIWRTGSKWAEIRSFCLAAVQNKCFNFFIIMVILISSVMLAVHENSPTLKTAGHVLDSIFTLIFVVEMVLKWLGLGIRTYFSRRWCRIEFLVVLACIYNDLAYYGGWDVRRVHRLARAFRLLYLPTRMACMKVIVDTINQSLPAIMQAVVLIALIWLPLALMAVCMFSGKFFICLDDYGEQVNPREEPTEEDCRQHNYTWIAAPIHFDNIGSSYLSLLQIATFKGWIALLQNAYGTFSHLHDYFLGTLYHSFFFIFFILVGPLLTLNLFVSILLESFKTQRELAQGFTPDTPQVMRLYHRALAKVFRNKPQQIILKPQKEYQQWCYKISSNLTFDLVMMVLVLANAVVCAMDDYQVDAYTRYILVIIEVFIILSFVLECAIKIAGHRANYFKDAWNIYDFVVTIISLFEVLYRDLFFNHLISFRLLRIARLLKLWRLTKDIRLMLGLKNLFHAARAALPDIFKVFLLHFIVVFIYALVGKILFENVTITIFIEGHLDFKTFERALLLLFAIFNSAGWDGIYLELTNQAKCPDGCPSYFTAGIYLVTFVIASYFVFYKLYLVIVIQYYKDASEDLEDGLVDEDIFMFHKLWFRFTSSHFMPLKDVQLFLKNIEMPLRISQPNAELLKALDMPVCTGLKVHMQDVLAASIRHMFESKGISTPRPEMKNSIPDTDLEFYQIITYTSQLSPEEFSHN